MTRITAGLVVGAAGCAVLLLTAAVGTSEGSFAALPATQETPRDNPSTPARVALGRILFWDPILSGDRDTACGTCHHPRFGYAENRDLSIGVSGVGLGDWRRFATGGSMLFVKRNSQTILNVAFNGIDEAGRHVPATAPMFWDVRALSLEQQALEPLKALEEMRGSTVAEDKAVDAIVARVAALPEYRKMFADAFGAEQSVTSQNLARALAAFQRSLTANRSPFDRYMRGDSGAMNASELQGMRRFERIGCGNCHTGPMFSDFKLHVLGFPDNPKLQASDAGAENTYAFRTASLRNLAFTAPYMHSGVFATLEDVLEFYDDVADRRGGDRNVNVSREQLDPLLRRLRGVDDDDEDLLAFLRALSDESFDKAIPKQAPGRGAHSVTRHKAQDPSHKSQWFVVT
jgi:cytochrome c peroxidase